LLLEIEKYFTRIFRCLSFYEFSDIHGRLPFFTHLLKAIHLADRAEDPSPGASLFAEGLAEEPLPCSL